MHICTTVLHPTPGNNILLVLLLVFYIVCITVTCLRKGYCVHVRETMFLCSSNCYSIFLYWDKICISFIMCMLFCMDLWSCALTVSLILCKSSLTLCKSSLTLCKVSLTLCKSSLTLCKSSLTLFKSSLSLYKIARE